MIDPARAQLQNRLALGPITQSAPGDRWRTQAMRSHLAPRLMFVNKGHGRITIAGLTSGFGPNNLIFIPAGTMYGFEAGPTVFGQILTIPLAMRTEWPDEAVHLRLRDVMAQKDMMSIFDSVEREMKSDKTGHSRAAHHHLGLLAVLFERQLERRTPEPNDIRSETASARLVAAYTDLVERHFRGRKGVADLAQELGVTSTHLTRCCKNTCGASALAILNDRIIFEARRLLRETDQPVQAIAAHLGFASPAYFSRSFQARAGQSPSDFRKDANHSP